MASLDFGLQGVHVLVSGASGGIGQAIVSTLLSLGARVTAQYNTQPRGLDTLEGVVALQADVTRETHVERLFAQASTRHGTPVHVLVANHGIFPLDSVTLRDMTLDQWHNTHDVNLTGSFLLCREFLRQLGTLDPGSPHLDAASICFIGSTAGKFGEADHGDYASTKSAIMYGLVPTLKNEIVRIAPRGRVNSINPGWVATQMAQALMDDERVLARALATTPLRKVATPVDVARQVAVVCSPLLSGHVSGVNVQVDGGMEGRLLHY